MSIILDGTGSGKRARVSSDNRLDVSARTDERIFYISRDNERAFSWFFEDDDAAAADFTAYLQNTSKTLRLVIHAVVVSSELASTVKLHKVTGVADTAGAVTATNLNIASGKTADDNALGGSAVGTITSSSVIEAVRVGANGTETFHGGDSIQLDTNDAIAVEYDTGTTGDFEVTIYGFYEGPENR